MKQIKQWRLAHPKASLDELEQALDEQLGRLRARMLEDLAQASDAVRLDELTVKRPRCPQCEVELIGRGQEARELETQHGQPLRLARSYAACPRCGGGLFPLDEELGLLPGQLTPRLQPSVVRLGAWLPFEKAAPGVAVFARRATVRAAGETADRRRLGPRWGPCRRRRSSAWKSKRRCLGLARRCSG